MAGCGARPISRFPYAWIHSAPVFGFGLMTLYTAVLLRRALAGEDIHYAEAADQK